MSASELSFGARIALVVAVWAAIYLPGLGTLEIKGEEGRRILPAIRMLETGNYIVPYVGSDPYFTKPPLINWLVAGSFTLFGQRNEWAARIPSAIAVLLAALAFVCIARRSLGPAGSLAAALIWMTNLGVVEKGRLIEIEALYASLTAIAFVCWLSWWQTRRSPWLTWTVPWIVLGLALLAKGPLHLLFFYAVAVAVLYRAGELRAFWHPAHAVGVALMVGIFAAWAIPCLWMMSEGNVAQTWSRQFTGRLSGEDFNLSGWLMNIPRGLGYFLPWTLLLPFAARRFNRTQRENIDVRSGLLWGIAISFVVVSVLPGSLPRYTMPLLAPAAWLVALLLTDADVQLPHWLQRERLPLIVAAVAAIAIAAYVIVVMPYREQRVKVRNIAAELNTALPPNEPLYAVDPEYQPALFYVREPIVYVATAAELPRDARWVLAQPPREAEVLARTAEHQTRADVVLRLTDYRKKEIILFQLPGRP